MVLPVVFYCAVPFYQGALRDLKNLRAGMDTPIAVAIIMTFIVCVYSLATNAGQGCISNPSPCCCFSCWADALWNTLPGARQAMLPKGW